MKTLLTLAFVTTYLAASPCFAQSSTSIDTPNAESEYYDTKTYDSPLSRLDSIQDNFDKKRISIESYQKNLVKLLSDPITHKGRAFQDGKFVPTYKLIINKLNEAEKKHSKTFDKIEFPSREITKLAEEVFDLKNSETALLGKAYSKYPYNYGFEALDFLGERKLAENEANLNEAIDYWERALDFKQGWDVKTKSSKEAFLKKLISAYFDTGRTGDLSRFLEGLSQRILDPKSEAYAQGLSALLAQDQIQDALSMGFGSQDLCQKNQMKNQEVVNKKNRSIFGLVNELIKSDQPSQILAQAFKSEDSEFPKKVGKLFYVLTENKIIVSDKFFITSKGVIFTRVEKEGFGKAWKDPSGMIWGELVGRMNYYDATKKCEAHGGVLPSKEDYERFRSYFDLQEDKLFTDKGITEVYAIMPDMTAHWFWSSSIEPGGSKYAFVFSGVNGLIFSFDGRDNVFLVRCVSR